jgi:hypothetical protein
MVAAVLGLIATVAGFSATVSAVHKDIADTAICARSRAVTENTGTCFTDEEEVFKCHYAMWDGSGGRGGYSGVSAPSWTGDGQFNHHGVPSQAWPANTGSYVTGENWDMIYTAPHPSAAGVYCHGFRTTSASTSVPTPPVWTEAVAFCQISVH